MVARRMPADNSDELTHSAMHATTGVDGIFLSADTSWQTELGWESADLIGTSLLERVHLDDHYPVIIALHHLFASGGSATFTCRYRRRDGTYTRLIWDVTLHIDELLLELAVRRSLPDV